jgi:hypothetical protein
MPHYALASVGARDVGELTLEGGGTSQKTLLRGFDVLDELSQHPVEPVAVTTSPRGAIQAANAGCRRLPVALQFSGCSCTVGCTTDHMGNRGRRRKCRR